MKNILFLGLILIMGNHLNPLLAQVSVKGHISAEIVELDPVIGLNDKNQTTILLSDTVQYINISDLKVSQTNGINCSITIIPFIVCGHDGKQVEILPILDSPFQGSYKTGNTIKIKGKISLSLSTGAKKQEGQYSITLNYD